MAPAPPSEDLLDDYTRLVDGTTLEVAIVEWLTPGEGIEGLQGRPGPKAQLTTVKEELRNSVLCVPGVADAQVEILLPAEKAFAEVQPPPQIRVALRMEAKVDVAAVVHLAHCAFPGVPEAEVTVLYL